VSEWPFPGGDPATYAEALARAKAESVVSDCPVVAADTVVVVDGDVLGKPGTPEEAAAMLRRLSGRTHEVVTGVAVKDGSGLRSGHSTARVSFRSLQPAEVEGYVATGEPMDKAGGYGLQGQAAKFLSRVEGDPDTVIGLPVMLVRTLLAGASQGGPARG
jgi:septum formation protein